MNFKVGDKVRIISYQEALLVYKDHSDAINFDIFKRDGGEVAYVTEITYRNVVKLSNGNRYRYESLKKVRSLDMELPKNLFEL